MGAHAGGETRAHSMHAAMHICICVCCFCCYSCMHAWACAPSPHACWRRGYVYKVYASQACAPVVSLLSTTILKRGDERRLIRNMEPSMFFRCCRDGASGIDGGCEGDRAARSWWTGCSAAEREWSLVCSSSGGLRQHGNSPTAGRRPTFCRGRPGRRTPGSAQEGCAGAAPSARERGIGARFELVGAAGRSGLRAPLVARCAAGRVIARTPATTPCTSPRSCPLPEASRIVSHLFCLRINPPEHCHVELMGLCLVDEPFAPLLRHGW
jgi:hypothetical protein